MAVVTTLHFHHDPDAPIVARIMSTLRSALRVRFAKLRRDPFFAIGAGTVLALGVAATTALLAVVRGVALRPLPYFDPDRLVVLVEDGTSAAAVDWPTSVGRLEDFGASGVFAGGLAGARGADLVLAGAGGAERLVGFRVSGNLFAVLGVAAQRGRLLAPADAREGAPPVAVLSEGLWRRRFGADPALVGSSLTLDGVARTVVGIAPPGFAWPRPDADVWVPFVATEAERNRAWFGLRTVGRLAPGLGRETAQERLRELAAVLDGEHPDTEKGTRPRLVPLLDHVLGGARQALEMLQAAVLLLLVIATANLANLLVARGAAREGELAVRTALGAGRIALLRMLLGEGLAIGAVAGLLGVPLGALALRAALAAAGEALPRAGEVRFDAGVAASGVAMALAAAAVASLAGAFTALARSSPAAATRGAGKGTSLGRRRSVLAALVVVEVAAATALAAGGGLLLRSLARVTATEPGFEARGVVTLEVAQPPGSDLASAAAYYRRLLERLRELPGFESISGVSRLPVVGSAASTAFEIEGRPNEPGQGPVADLRYVEPGALPLLRVPLLEGRDVGPRDTADAPRVVLVNEAFARAQFPGGDALGKRMFWAVERGEWRTIVGVVGDVHLAELERPVQPTIWSPVAQATFPGSTRVLSVVARSPLPAQEALDRLRAGIASFDALQAPARARSLEEAIAGSLAARRLHTGLFLSLALIAGLLAAIGVYAVVSYSVLARFDEFGVRLALGSRRARLVQLVVGQALRLGALGAAIGAGIAVAGNKLISASLVETRPWDPRVLGAVVAAALAASILAAALPAVRAARVSPQRALRSG